MSDDQSKLEQIYDQVHGLEEKLLFAGLTVLVKDTADFLHKGGYSDPLSEEFRSMYLAMYNIDRYYWEHFGPELYKTLEETGLPFGIVENVVGCTVDMSRTLRISPLSKNGLLGPGWLFFKTYSELLQPIILGRRDTGRRKATR